MDIVIGYESALAYWRSVGLGFLHDSKARRRATLRAQKALAVEEKPQLEGGNFRPAGCGLPVHTLVGKDVLRTRTKSVTSSVWATLPERSIIDAGMGFLMSSPEFCFLQMATRLSLAKLIQLCFELCGTYAVVDDGSSRERSAPLTSVTKLRAFVQASSNAPGRTKALRALYYCMDGSASPMETVLTMLLCLPYGLGGYGIERPQLNYQVDVPSSMRSVTDRAYCKADLCWPEAKLCVEYDSKKYHLDPERQESDSRRRNTLVVLGFTMMVVSRGQIADGGAFNRLAKQIAIQTGKRLRYRDPGFTRKHLALRDELLETLHEAE
ncbi:hypothetical protein [Raoultibacter phocaeensis]|uniref:hypothetical protein n=1 Tax=Raoultibacter phocaeensis TaxID=2479841 RepID=UPI0021050567|nr:hypothetical protein [Raoultibacter phocaeensis]